mmetsp:Transcript_19176/g.22087  ORF Transcript_19176/g.22087 Transcript_19176/m.22087 type:complete len:107 (+) Transcript_19176:257-577(+)
MVFRSSYYFFSFEPRSLPRKSTQHVTWTGVCFDRTKNKLRLQVMERRKAYLRCPVIIEYCVCVFLNCKNSPPKAACQVVSFGRFQLLKDKTSWDVIHLRLVLGACV